MDEKFEVGETARLIVGLPGPDVEDCEVVEAMPDGTYRVKFKVHGLGQWHEEIAFPNERRTRGLFKAKPNKP